MMAATPGKGAHQIGLTSLVALFILCVLWESVIAPIRPGGSWLVLKALPLLLPLWPLLMYPAKRRYTYQWSTMFIWLYFTEGAVRMWSDFTPLSQWLAALEVLLCSLFFVAAIIYVRQVPKLTTPPSAVAG